MSLILAEMVAGVGLFFLGLHLVNGNLHQTSSRRLRTLNRPGYRAVLARQLARPCIPSCRDPAAV